MRQFAARQFIHRQFPVRQYKDAITVAVLQPALEFHGGGFAPGVYRLGKDLAEWEAREALRCRIIREDEEFLDVIAAVAFLRII